MRLTNVVKFRNCLPHYFDGSLVVSSRNRLFRIRDLGNPRLEPIGKIPWRFSQQASRLRLAERVLKNGITHVHPYAEDRHFIVTGKGWWSLGPDGSARPVQQPSPTRPLSRGICSGSDGFSYISEYTRNPDRHAVHIWKTLDFETYAVAWEFPAGTIRHVHALIQDPVKPRRMWVLTGDLDNESIIWTTDDSFASLDKYLSSGQISRATDLVFQNDNLLWGMDSPVETSYILKHKHESGHMPERQFELPGPVYYAATNEAGGTYFGTTAEPGASVKDNFAHIFASSPGGEWQEIHKSKSDLLPQFGIIYFPRGLLPENWVIFSQRGTQPGEGYMTIARDIAWES